MKGKRFIAALLMFSMILSGSITTAHAGAVCDHAWMYYNNASPPSYSEHSLYYYGTCTISTYTTRSARSCVKCGFSVTDPIQTTEHHNNPKCPLY